MEIKVLITTYHYFSPGFVIGAGVFAGELLIYVGNEIMDVFKSVFTSPQTTQVFTTYSTSIEMLIVGGFIVNIAIGYLTPVSFSSGFLLGDLFMIAILASALQQIAPPVLVGMIIAFLAVLLGIVLKMVLGKGGNQYRQYDYWG